ncbi:MAG TPA: hypothetical protein VLY21_07660 [Nitrososphaerales archaeon]|nr:hypothetical protein [Nitrososphaerales archaeon]
MGITLDILQVAQALIFVFGVIVIYYASRAYSRHRSRSMLFLAIGFAIVTIGAVAAGVLFELLSVGLETVEAIQAVSQAIGFFIIVYSLVGTKE